MKLTFKLSSVLVLLMLFCININAQETKGYILSVEKDIVYLDYTNKDVKSGDKLQVIKSGGYFKHPVTNKKIKKKDEYIANIKIVEAEESYSEAIVIPPEDIMKISKGMKAEIIKETETITDYEKPEGIAKEEKRIITSDEQNEVFFDYSPDNFTINFSQTYSRFKFIDSEGNVDENMKSDIRYSYALNYNKIFESGFYLRPELGYKNFGAVSIFNNQKLEWNLHYIDFNIGAGYILYVKKFKPFFGASFYTSFLYKAGQLIGINYYDMMENDAIKTIDCGFNLHAGATYSFNEMVSLFIEYRNTTGFTQLELNSETVQSQKLYNRAMSIHFGLCFYITNK